MMRAITATIVLLVLCGVVRSLQAQANVSGADLTDEHVRKAIDCLVEALHARRRPDRFWELDKVPANESTRQGGGYTALTVLALLYSGQSYQDERLRDAIEYLAKLQLQGSYATMVRTSVWARLPDRFHDQLKADAQWLLDGFNPTVGGWDYVQNPTGKYHDNSLRQFGALALWEAAKRDVKIDRRAWQILEDTFIKLQRADGGWNYKEDQPSTGSMTAAGLATLFITQDLLHADEAVKLPPPRSEARPATRPQKAIDAGMAWMDQHFSASANPGKDMYFYYYLYGVERVGLASGYKFFGGHDWYREGAAEIIRRLCKWEAGTETYSLKSTAEAPSMTDEIAFGLMFLSRGRVPVAVNKLRFDGAWNNRPRDVANMVDWIGSISESALNWQIVDMAANPQQWLDAPMVYLASHQPLPWLKDAAIDAEAFAKQAREFMTRRAAGELDPDAKPPAAPDIKELAQLKCYIDLGGMVLAINEGGSRQFAESLEDAGVLMYPQYQWRDLPDDHWAYTLHAPVKGRRPPLRGLSNGVRELIILCTAGDLSATFQKADEREQGEYQTAANIYYYASEMNRPRPRLGRHHQPDHAASAPGQAIQIVRGLHAGNWKPEPLALHVFAAAMSQQRRWRITVSDAPLSSIHQISPPPTLVMVSGIDAHEYAPAEIVAIKAYVEGGGIIVFETPGGRGQFTAAAEQMAQTVFGGSVQSALQSRAITGEGLNGGVDVSRIDYRPFSLEAFGARETAPRLRMMSVEGEPRLFFSREDISHALLDQPCWGISGYSPRSALDLLANIVQHAAARPADHH